MDPNSTQSSNPYAAPQARVADVTSTEGELASRWLRLAGLFIDGLILSVIILPVYFLLFWSTISAGKQPDFPSILGYGVFGFLVFLAVQGYFLNATGQTIAKKLLKMKIVDENGNKPEFTMLIAKRYAVFQFAGLVPILGIVLPLVDGLFIFRDDRRCLHDLLAGTRVVMTE